MFVDLASAIFQIIAIDKLKRHLALLEVGLLLSNLLI